MNTCDVPVGLIFIGVILLVWFGLERNHENELWEKVASAAGLEHHGGPMGEYEGYKVSVPLQSLADGGAYMSFVHVNLKQPTNRVLHMRRQAQTRLSLVATRRSGDTYIIEFSRPPEFADQLLDNQELTELIAGIGQASLRKLTLENSVLTLEYVGIPDKSLQKVLGASVAIARLIETSSV
ncbi:MAG: hypothetical protein DPW16_08995 [Chloroflexi bacterium]|nr:hypothetical protein [Chloroflexota bacterium]